jgi:hypothetical protein
VVLTVNGKAEAVVQGAEAYQRKYSPSSAVTMAYRVEL